MTSDHSPVFASFEVGVASQYVSKQGTSTPYVSVYYPGLHGVQYRHVVHVYILFSDPEIAPQGGIQIMNCVAMLLTKSKTKFFIEYHSSFLESKSGPFCLLNTSLLFRLEVKLFCLWMSTETVKTLEGENTEHSDGSIKVWFGNQVVVKKADPALLFYFLIWFYLQYINICVNYIPLFIYLFIF